MPVLKKQFYHHEKGNHFETWFFLAKDTDTSKVYIIHEWDGPGSNGSSDMSVEEFLINKKGSATDKFLALIGTAIKDR